MEEKFLIEIKELSANEKRKSLNDKDIKLNYQKFKELLKLTDNGYYFSTVLDSKIYRDNIKILYFRMMK